MVTDSVSKTKNYRILCILLTFSIGIISSYFLVLNPKIATVFIWLFLWIFIFTIFLNKFLEKRDTKTLLPFIIGGLSVRLVMAFLFRIKSASTGGLITPDEFYYFDYAKDIAEAWKAGNLILYFDTFLPTSKSEPRKNGQNR